MGDELVDREKDCTRASKAIEDLGEGQVGRLRWMLVRRHVKECPECGTYFDRMNAVVETLANMQRVDAPEELVALVMAGLIRTFNSLRSADEEAEHERRNRLLVAGAAVFGLAVAIAAVVFRSAIGKELKDRMAIAGHA